MVVICNIDKSSIRQNTWSSRSSQHFNVHRNCK